MAQWINILWNNNFVNWMQLAVLCRNFRAVALVEPGLMTGWLIYEIQLNFEFLKFIINRLDF